MDGGDQRSTGGVDRLPYGFQSRRAIIVIRVGFSDLGCQTFDVPERRSCLVVAWKRQRSAGAKH